MSTGGLTELLDTSGIHFFPNNTMGRALVWDGQRVLHSAIYYRASNFHAAIENTRKSLEVRFTTLAQYEIEEYARCILQEMCEMFLAQ